MLKCINFESLNWSKYFKFAFIGQQLSDQHSSKVANDSDECLREDHYASQIEIEHSNFEDGNIMSSELHTLSRLYEQRHAIVYHHFKDNGYTF